MGRGSSRSLQTQNFLSYINYGACLAETAAVPAGICNEYACLYAVEKRNRNYSSRGGDHSLKSMLAKVAWKEDKELCSFNIFIEETADCKKS